MNFSISKEGILDLYRNIDEKDFDAKILFYQRNKEVISKFDVNSRIDIEIDHLVVLFQKGFYRQFLDKCDLVIGYLFDSDQIEVFEREKVAHLLFLKSAAYYNLKDYQKSYDTSITLLKIDKDKKKINRQLIERIVLRKTKTGLNSLAALLFSALTIILSIEIIQYMLGRDFIDQWTQKGNFMAILVCYMALLWLMMKSAILCYAKIKSHYLINNIL